MKKFTWLAAAIFLMVSCTSTDNNQAQESTEVVAEEHHDHHEHHEHHDSDSEEIELNNGERWLVNEEMKPHLMEAETALAEFVEEGSQDFNQLVETLKTKNTALIKSCTMDGKSHDELHKWLHPHLELVDELEKAQDEQEATNLVQKLSESYELYHQHFQ